MIVRCWHGYTKPNNASAYKSLLKNEIIPAILAQHAKELKAVKVLQNSSNDEVEFVTLFFFTSIAAIKEFAGSNYQQAFVPVSAQKLLYRYDEFVKHYELLDDLTI